MDELCPNTDYRFINGGNKTEPYGIINAFSLTEGAIRAYVEIATGTCTPAMTGDACVPMLCGGFAAARLAASR
ncbi:MAG: hypothetical protein PUC29_08665 [Clostridia bacterium]|nr:hypothetical protein [Clostridia bacterium]